MRTTYLFASTLMLVACATTTDESGPGGSDGKLDGIAPIRSATLMVDNRPADGSLVTIHIVPRGRSSSQITIETTTRTRRGERRRSEVLIDNGECGLGLDAITCNEDPVIADVLFEAVRTGDTWTVTTHQGEDTTTLGTGMRATHLRFSRHVSHPDGAVELTVDAGAAGQVVTVRRPATPDEELPSEIETVMTAGTCTVDAGEMTCVEDKRPVDGALQELKLELLTPGGPYRATLRTSSLRLDGESRDTTRVLADELNLR